MQKSLSAAIALLLPFSAFANCEAGGYSIHTVAKYAERNSLEASVMTYKLEKTKVMATLGSIFEESDFSSVKGVALTVQLGSEKCEVKEGFTSDPKYVEGDPYSAQNPFWLELSACKDLIGKIPSSGYLFVNTVLKTARFGKKLDVKEAKTDAYAELRKAAALDARKRKLERAGRIAEMGTGSWTEPANVEIKASEIKGDETTVLEIGKDFRLLTHVLHLSPLPPLSKGQKEMVSGPSVTPLAADSGKLVTYPVLYFVPPKAKAPKYIGDGSYCSSNIGIKGDKNDQGKFNVTNAFDYDLDGNPDLLEVNDSFTYWIDQKGEPLVINYGMGC